MDKLQKKMRDVQEAHAEETLSAHLQEHQLKDVGKAMLLLGGINVADKISQTLGAESMRALIRFQEEKHYELLGYDNFVEFLTASEYSPMTKNQFYDRKAILEKEGDSAFDLFNSLSLSINKRKLLGAGNVQLDGETVIVTTTGADGEQRTEEIEITDRARLLQTLSALADQAATLNVKNIRQREKIEKGESEIEKLQKKLDSGAFTNKGESAHFEMFMRAITAMNDLSAFVKKMTLVEKVAIEDQSLVYLRSFNSALSRLAQSYGHQQLAFDLGFDEDAPPRKMLAEMTDKERKKHVAKLVGDENEFASIASDLNDDELEDLMD